MRSEHDKWNLLKKKIDTKTNIVSKFPQPGEVWIGSLGKNIGYEQNGSGDTFSRPLLVIYKFNNHMFWCVPLSTKQKELDFYFNFEDPEGRQVSAVIAQLRLISLKRLERKLYMLTLEIFLEIKSKINSYL